MKPDFSDLTPGARVVVAMSGGVDSSVTAALLAEAGFDVVGVTLQLYDHGAAVTKPGSCCAGQDILDARRVAELIGIPHYVLDFEALFKEEVIDDFVDSYLGGETPIPCVRCNQTVKFRDLLARARELDALALATGHYVRRVEGPGGTELHRGRERARDQSYFLFATTQDQLDYLRFPIGHLSKDEVRAQAQRLGLAVADKPDSQDICFVPEGGYASVVEKLRSGALDPGDIVDREGRVLGRHEGIINYTVGQRRGLGIGGGDPLFVLAVDPADNRVVVGPREALLGSRVTVRNFNWLGDEVTLEAGREFLVKLRSQTDPVPAVIDLAGDGAAEVMLNEPQGGIAPGQACVVYDGDRLLGGGWITRPQDAVSNAA